MKLVYDPLEEKILYEIAKLHKKYINQGFLSSLGEDFLKCVYRSISLSKESYLIVAKEREKVLGFIAGTTNIKDIKLNLIRYCKFVIFKTFIKLLLKPSKMRKFFETASYSFSSKYENIPAELLSIVVIPEYRGKNISKQLYKQIMFLFKEKGIREFKIIVGTNLKTAQKFYEKMGARKLGNFELHKGKKSIIYVHRLEEKSL